MSKILNKRNLTAKIDLFTVKAPLIADKAQPGHFVIVRASETGERIPLTIVDYDRQAGNIDLVIQAVGNSTQELCSLEKGDEFRDLLGPLGNPVEIKQIGTVICVAGGLGVAPIYPKAKYLKEAGNEIISIIGAKTEEMLIMKEEMKEVSDEIYFSTEDGSLGEQGFVTEVLGALLEECQPQIDEVIAIGPAVMMEAVCGLTREYDLKTVVSLNPIMVDGTGMCGGCRVTVGGKQKFACVDGPVFDGQAVDFAELRRRQSHYQALEEEMHACKLEQEAKEDD